MKLLCALGWHRPSPEKILNEGRTFSRCARCGIDLVETKQGWKPAPRGYRVVWKKTAQPSPLPLPKAKPAPKKRNTRKVTPEPEAGQRKDRRRRPDRRVAKSGELPPHITKERRRARNRRSGFGKKPDQPEAPPES